MNRNTAILVILALGAAGAAYSMRPIPPAEAKFEDTGLPLFDGFSDPTLATALEVQAWDEDEATVIRFSVEQKEGKWVIPSHNNYPADGTERMGKAAASFIGVKKDFYYGDNPDDYAAYGVLDPEETQGKGEEKGQRITVKDASGTVLVDIIVGKQVEEKQGMYYVRKPDNKRVYGARLELDISTKFADWIEKELLFVERDEVVKLHYDPYKVDEGTGKVVDQNPVLAEVVDKDGKDEWVAAMGFPLPDGKILDSMKARQIATAAANIKIVGVRPQPDRRNPALFPALNAKGFFVAPQSGRLFGNEGQLSLMTKDGLVYTLFFGEVTYESGMALTAGKEQPTESEPDEGDEEGADEGGADDENKDEGDTTKTASRYMFVSVSYDESLDQNLESKKPKGEGEDGPDGEDGPGAEDAGDDDSEPDAGDAQEDDKKKLQGAQRAAKLRERFDKWFYVISDQSFKQIHKERDEMFKDAPEEEKPPSKKGAKGDEGDK